MKPSETQSMQHRFLQILTEQIESIHKALKNADPNDPHTIKLHRLLLSYMREYRQMEKHGAQAKDAESKPNLVVKEIPVDRILQAAKRQGNGVLSKQEFMKEIEKQIWGESGKEQSSRGSASPNTALLAKPA